MTLVVRGKYLLRGALIGQARQFGGQHSTVVKRTPGNHGDVGSNPTTGTVKNENRPLG